MMTGNIPSYPHTQASLPNSREERERERGWGKEMGERRRGGRLKEMKVERDKDRQGWKEEDEARMER